MTVGNLNYLITAEIVTKIFYVLYKKKRDIYIYIWRCVVCVFVVNMYVCTRMLLLCPTGEFLLSCVHTHIYLNKKKRERGV